jgi:hypothetical protein
MKNKDIIDYMRPAEWVVALSVFGIIIMWVVIGSVVLR